MVEIDVSEYLNTQTAQDGDIVEIVGEGEYSTIRDNRTQREKKVLNIPVLLNEKQLIYTPSKGTLRDLAKRWGKDTKDWIGKKFQVDIREIEAFGRLMSVVRPRIIED